MQSDLRPDRPQDLAAYDFELPEDLIAQHGLAQRDAARLLWVDRSGQRPLKHDEISRLPDGLREGDLLVLNSSRVLPARLCGEKISGGRAEALLLGPAPGDGDSDRNRSHYRALVGCRGRLRVGLKLQFNAAQKEGPPPSLDAEVVSVGTGGEAVLAFPAHRDPYGIGQAPLPPYLERASADGASVRQHLERYQTVYARQPGSVAAPTAGLHFTPGLLEELSEAGISTAFCVLHVGPGTFQPLDRGQFERGRLHAEAFELPEETAEGIKKTQRDGGRVIAVGTTTARVLESCVDAHGRLRAQTGTTELFIRPGDPFRAIDGLLTNFHLPRSSLLLLVAAFAGRENILTAYTEAIRERYRFYSYGDAMLIL